MKYKLNETTIITVTPAEKNILDFIKNKNKNKNAKDDRFEYQGDEFETNRYFSLGDIDQILDEIKSSYESKWELGQERDLKNLFIQLGQERGEERENREKEINQELEKIPLYRSSVNNYKLYLEQEIRNEVNKIEPTLLNTIKNTLDPSSPMPSNPEDLKDQISKKLLVQYIEDDQRPTIDGLLVGRMHLMDDLKKYDVIVNAEKKLDKENDKGIENIENFFNHLKNNKAILTKRKDTGLKTFFKGLGVTAATIFGLGVGGFFAHKHLFGSKATEGAKFVAEVSSTRKSNPIK